MPPTPQRLVEREPDVRPDRNPESTARDALARSLCARICTASRSRDELRVIDRVLSGLEQGAEIYGALDLARDERDFGVEGEQELRDFLVYAAAREIAAIDRRLERLRCEAADEIAARIEPGLRELRDSAPAHDWPGPVDFSGEAP